MRDSLVKHVPPRKIDHISTDTEGSRCEIPSAFNIDKYEFGVLTVEHNFGRYRKKILELLTEKGYMRKFPNLSGVDDWYVRRNNRPYLRKTHPLAPGEDFLRGLVRFLLPLSTLTRL